MPDQIEATNLGPIQPNSVIIIKMGRDRSVAESAQVAQKLAERLIEARIEGTTVFLMKPEDTMELVSEKEMNRNGWFRAQQTTEMRDIMEAKLVEIHTDQAEKRLWVNLDGQCVLRICEISKLMLRQD